MTAQSPWSELPSCRELSVHLQESWASQSPKLPPPQNLCSSGSPDHAWTVTCILCHLVPSISLKELTITWRKTLSCISGEGEVRSPVARNPFQALQPFLRESEPGTPSFIHFHPEANRAWIGRNEETRTSGSVSQCPLALPVPAVGDTEARISVL